MRIIEDLTIEDAKTIWLHVIRKAVEDFKNGAKARTQEGHTAHVDAEHWLWSDEEEFPSFLFLCEVLDLDFRRIRRELSGYQLR